MSILGQPSRADRGPEAADRRRHLHRRPRPATAPRYVTYVRSTMAHARIVAIDIAEALAAPGCGRRVHRRRPRPRAVPLDIFDAARDRCPAVPGQRRRPLRRRAGRRGPHRGARPGRRRRRAGGGRLRPAARRRRPRRRRSPARSSCSPRRAPTWWRFEIPGEAAVVRRLRGRRRGQRIVNQRGRAAARSRSRAAAAAWTTTAGSSTGRARQGAHGARPPGHGLRPRAADQVRVITPDVGGGFGAKGCSYPEELLCRGCHGSSAGRCAGSRPAARTWSASATAGARCRTWRSAGRATARRWPTGCDVLQDAGAYPPMGGDPAVHDPDDADRDLRHPDGRVRRLAAS